MRLRTVVALPALVSVIGVLAVSFFANRGISEPTVETTVAHYTKELRAIGAEVPLQDDLAGNWRQQAQVSLARVKANAEKAGSIARDLEQQLATKSSGCIFAKAAANAIDEAIAPARAAAQNALDGLISETKDRITSLNKDNSTLGWTGWRGSREEEIFELVLLSHDVETAAANADLAFTRLQNDVTALNRMTAACR